MNQYAIITGASGGIGSAIAGKLAREGYDLALIGNHRTDRLDGIAADCRKSGAAVDTFTVDCSDPAAIRKALAHLPVRRPIDLLVNCAGISHIGLLADMGDGEWDRVMDTNLSSVFYMCRLVVPAMVREKRGHILNISSIWGNGGASCEVAYSATKGGVNAFTKALAKELAPSGIAVNAIAYGMIDTPMNRGFTPEEIASICEAIPAGRMGTPEEAADVVALLAKAPVYLTGQIIGVDGGW